MHHVVHIEIFIRWVSHRIHKASPISPISDLLLPANSANSPAEGPSLWTGFDSFQGPVSRDGGPFHVHGWLYCHMLAGKISCLRKKTGNFHVEMARVGSLSPNPPHKKRYWYCELYAKNTTSNQYIYHNNVDSINQPRFLPSPFFDVFIVWDSLIGTVDYILHHLFCELYMHCNS